MDNININKESINLKSLVNEQFAEQGVEADITLPDYYQDIVRILKCNIYPVINSVSVSGECVTADGVAYIKIIYAGEEQNFYCYEMSYPFSKTCDINGLGDDCKVFSEACIESCNCRAVTSRRIDIRSSLKISFKVMRLKQIEAVECAEGGGLELMNKECRMLNTVNMCEKAFSVSETVDLPEDKPAVLRVLRSDASCIISEVKVISNKLMLKGEALINLLYISEDGGDEIASNRFSVLFNEIFEVQGLTNDHICDVKLTVNSVETTIKARSSGEARSLEFALRMTSVIAASEIKAVNAAVDSYSTQFGIEAAKMPVDIVKSFSGIEENVICKGNIDLTDVSPSRIIDVSVTGVSHSTHCEEYKAVLKGTICLAILYSTSDGNVGYREKNIDLYFEKMLEVSAVKLQFDPAISVIALNYNCPSINEMDVKVELVVRGSLFALEEQRIISEINVLEDIRNEKRGKGLFIYFAEKEERVWDIARSYNISSQLLKNENKLDSDIIDEPCELLIPCI